MSGPFGSSQWMYNSGGDFYPYQITRNARFEDGNSSYLNRTPSSAGNTKTWTTSVWVKRGNIGVQTNIFNPYTGGDGSNESQFHFKSDDTLRFYDSGGLRGNAGTSAKFRDVGAWYHIVLRVDTTQATASNRIRIYVNGENMALVNQGYGSTYPSQNAVLGWNGTSNHYIGTYRASNHYFDGYMAEFHHVDGQSLAPTEFGETKSGIWIPKEYTGTYGTNGFYLHFGSDLGYDQSGNGNNFSVSSMDLTHDFNGDDTPTNNFPVVNNLQGRSGTSFSEGNLLRYSDPSGYDHGGSTMALPKSGKWYVEWMPHSQRSNDPPVHVAGIGPTNQSITTYTGGATNSYGWAMVTGSATVYKYSNGSYGGTYAGGAGNMTLKSTIFQLAVDMDSGKIWFGINNVWKNLSGTAANPSNGTNPAYTLTAAQMAKNHFEFKAGRLTNDSGRWTRMAWNFGQDSTFAGNKTAGGNSDANGIGDFQYEPPTDFLALCSANLPELDIDPANNDAPEDYFNTVTYSGNSTARDITSVGFQSDFTWIKCRNVARYHDLVDAVRGDYKLLRSNRTDQETTANQTIDLGNANGFSLGTDSGSDGVNKTGENYVAWNWLAGNGTSSNTDGSITSTISHNSKAGFSIIGYTGTGSNTSVGHGLGAKPDLMIFKNRNSTNNWLVYHKDMHANPEQKRLFLNTNGALTDSSTPYNDTAPTSSVINLGTSGYTNGNGNGMICYAFVEKEGYSKFGSYTGNGSSDGAFIYTGFRPAFIILKRTDSSANWIMLDNRRIGYNVENYDLSPDQTLTDEDNNRLDIVSNGFKFRSTYGTGNTNGGTYVYIAFAEQPFKYANAR